MTKFKDGIEIYYLFRCDDKRKVEGVVPDKHFDLGATGDIWLYKDKLDSNRLNYDYLLEIFSTTTDEIIDNYYIVSNNHLNN
jgi:hypothetical protein